MTNKNKFSDEPRYQINDLVPYEVHRITGFNDILALLRYILIICGGDVEVIAKKGTRLIWLEEWLVYLEYIYMDAHLQGGEILKRIGI